ncbi:MAG: TonB-dependent receptor [Candidatus Marinimicrobia bacterium]|nr:TonB-dependent receptor [Candidatus Neomarinimicrobiota bacterium]
MIQYGFRKSVSRSMRLFTRLLHLFTTSRINYKLSTNLNSILNTCKIENPKKGTNVFMYKFISYSLLIGLFSTSILLAQPPQRGNSNFTGTITGAVVDSTSEQPMEYANVIVYSMRDSSQVTGAITNNRGRFLLDDVPAGRFFVQVSFMGYGRKYIDSVMVSPRNPEVNLGEVILPQTALSSEEVTVEGERPPISYQIDKKVIDVASQPVAAAGNAVDVLETAPSIQVDIEGNVSLRGSGNFRVLIDGKPTVLDAQNALEQIPSSSIDNIEIITNPSARYSAEGTAGIINIVMKHNALEGMAGMVNVNAGANDKYGGELTLNYKNENYTATIGADYNRRLFNMDRTQRSETYRGDETFFVNSAGAGDFGRLSQGLRAGIEYNLSPNDALTFNGRIGKWGMLFDQRQRYSEWTSGDINDVDLYTSITDRTMNSIFYSLSTDYMHQYAQKGHELSGQLQYSLRESEEETTDELRPSENVINEGRLLTESGPEDEFRFKLDYVRPFSETNKMEAGLQADIEQSDENTDFFNYDTLTSNYIRRDEFSNSALYEKNISAAYAMYSGETGNLGYQLGVRGEYTYRDITLPEQNQNFNIDRLDYFPTLHTSYSISGINQAMASYSRRIDRPRSWYLEPFETWTDAYNVRTGNPGLKPEYIDSYELGYQTRILGAMVSTEAYYRVTQNTIDRIQSVYPSEQVPDFVDNKNSITLHSVQNVGTDYRLGMEFMTRFSPLSAWNINLTGSFFDYRIEGTLNDQDFSRSSFNWNARMSNSLELWEDGQIQLNAFYSSPSVSAQGEREGFIMTDLAVRQDFLDNSLSAIFQVRDLLGTGNREFITSGENFYRYNYMERESPVIMLTLRYNINNYRSNEQRRGGASDAGGDFEGGEF